MWHLYNLIQEVRLLCAAEPYSMFMVLLPPSPSFLAQGDRVRAAGFRRVQNISATGSSESRRIRVTLTLEVTKVTWLASVPPAPADSYSYHTPPPTSATVEVTGRVAQEHQVVRLGAFHTLALEANKDVRIEKDEGGWDTVALSRVSECCQPGRGAEVAAIVCGEGGHPCLPITFVPHHLKCFLYTGSAIFCLLSEHMTVVLQRLEVPIPRKISSQSSAHEKVCHRFASLSEPLIRCRFSGVGAVLPKPLRLLPSTRPIFLAYSPCDRDRFSWMGPRCCI